MFNEIIQRHNLLIKNHRQLLVTSVVACSLIINFLTIVIAFYSMQIFDKVLNASSVETLIYITLFTIILVYFVNYFSNLRFFLNQKIADNYIHKIISNLRRINDSRLKINAFENLQKIRNFHHGPASLAVYDMLLSSIYIVVIFLIHPLIASYGLIVMILLISCEKICCRKSDLAKQHYQDKSLINTELYGKIRGQIIAPNHPFHDTMIVNNLLARWLSQYRSLGYLEKRYFSLVNYLNFLNRNLRLVAQIFATMICAYLVIKNQISVGSIIAVSILLSKLLEPFTGFDNNLKMLREFIKIRSNLAYSVDDNLPLQTQVNEALLADFKKINFTKVFFRDALDKNAILQIDKLTIMPHKVIAIFANSKFEEDALLNLLNRRYIPLFGEIEFNEYNLQKISSDHLAKVLAIIHSKPELYAGSIAENIAKMSLSFDIADIINFTNDVGVADDFKNYPQGYLTSIDDLSAWHQYLIGAVRAIYFKPKLLFVEKVPNFYTEPDYLDRLMKIFKYFKNHYAMTIFLTNPNIKILSECDEVIVFKEGRLNFFNTTEFINLYDKTPSQIN